MKIKKVIHYAEHDTDFCKDFYSIELFINGELIKHYGDWYHDKGQIKCEEFIKGIKFASDKEVEVITEQVADGKMV